MEKQDDVYVLSVYRRERVVGLFLLNVKIGSC